MDSSTPKTTSTGLIHITDKEFSELTTFIQRKYGINLTKKRVLIEGRMSNMLRDRGLMSFKEYMDVLFSDNSGSEVTNLLNKLTTNHSYFMREKEHWDYLSNVVLPDLEKKNERTKDIRIWSAGCSAGQEPYTLAMAIDEYFGPRKAQWDTTILATDISMNVLAKANTAIYDADNLKDVPQKWISKYFIQLPDNKYQVCEKIRKEVVFKTFNLMEKPPFAKPFDLILCRNVMIYFDGPTKDALVERFYDHTTQNGYFFIGHSEVINREVTRYSYIKPAIYQKREK